MEDLTSWVIREAQNMGVDFSCLTPQTRNSIISILMSGLENGFRSRMDSPDLRFAKRRGIGKQNQSQNIYLSQSDIANTIELALDDSCSYRACSFTECTNSGCTNTGSSGESCTNTGSAGQSCTDCSCSNVAEGGCSDDICTDTGGCSNDGDGGCTDSNGCEDVNGCTNNSSQGGCTDNTGCVDGSQGTSICTNEGSGGCSDKTSISTNPCTDSICNNTPGNSGGSCTDENNCVDDPKCVNQPKDGECKDSDSCVDTKCNNMNPNMKPCIDDSGCIDNKCCNRRCGDIPGKGNVSCSIDQLCINSRDCLDNHCWVGEVNKCGDVSCINSSSSTTGSKVGCTDVGSCIDAPCANYLYSCEDSGSGYCLDNACTNSLENQECLDSATCQNYTNGRCYDSFSTCSNTPLSCGKDPDDHSNCYYVKACIDEVTCIDSPCSDQTNCVDKSGSSEGCTDDGCGNEPVSTSSTANCQDWGGFCSDEGCANGDFNGGGGGLCIDDTGCIDTNCSNMICVDISEEISCPGDNNCSNVDCITIGPRDSNTCDNDPQGSCIDHVQANCRDARCDPP